MKGVKLFTGGLFSFLMVFAFVSISYGTTESLAYQVSFQIEEVGVNNGLLTVVASYDHEKLKKQLQVNDAEMIETVIQLHPLQGLLIEKKNYQILIDQRKTGSLWSYTKNITHFTVPKNGAYACGYKVLYVYNGKIIDETSGMIFVAYNENIFRLVGMQEWKKIAFPKNMAPVTKEQMMMNLEEDDIPGVGVRAPDEPQSGLRCGNDCHDGNM